jgi:hypothetical protein
MTPALDYAAALANTNTDTLVHMVIVHDEGTVAGDAAWIALQTRAGGFFAARDLVDAERSARAADIEEQRAAA